MSILCATSIYHVYSLTSVILDQIYFQLRTHSKILCSKYSATHAHITVMASLNHRFVIFPEAMHNVQFVTKWMGTYKVVTFDIYYMQFYRIKLEPGMCHQKQIDAYDTI